MSLFVDSFFSFRSSFIYTSRHAKTHCGPSGTHTHTQSPPHIYMCLCVCVYTHVPACLHTCVYVYYIVFRQALLSSSILHTSSNLLYCLLMRLVVGCSLDCNVYFVVKKNKKKTVECGDKKGYQKKMHCARRYKFPSQFTADKMILKA